MQFGLLQFMFTFLSVGCFEFITKTILTFFIVSIGHHDFSYIIKNHIDVACSKQCALLYIFSSLEVIGYFKYHGAPDNKSIKFGFK